MPVITRAEPAEERSSRRDQENEDGEQHLQAEAPGNHRPFDGAAVAGEEDADRENDREADDSRQAGGVHRRSASSARASSSNTRRSGHGR